MTSRITSDLIASTDFPCTVRTAGGIGVVLFLNDKSAVPIYVRFSLWNKSKRDRYGLPRRHVQHAVWMESVSLFSRQTQITLLRTFERTAEQLSGHVYHLRLLPHRFRCLCHSYGRGWVRADIQKRIASSLHHGSSEYSSSQVYSFGKAQVTSTFIKLDHSGNSSSFIHSY
jgi:hypothetical protein